MKYESDRQKITHWFGHVTVFSGIKLSNFELGSFAGLTILGLMAKLEF